MIVSHWEIGAKPIPYRVALVLTDLEQATQKNIDQKISKINNTNHLIIYRISDQLKQIESNSPQWATARWRRQLSAKIQQRNPKPELKRLPNKIMRLSLICYQMGKH
jgi:hypothetical protein